MKNLMIIVVGPSGAGKSSFVDRLTEEQDDIVDIITCTTRDKRIGESDGAPYFFLSEEEFKQRIDQGRFAEWAHVHGKLYGTPMDQIEESWAKGRAVIMDVDVQGAKTFMAKFPEEAQTIFIHPPSIEALRQRVLGRDGDRIKDLDLRMKNAEIEMNQASDFHFEVMNDDFEKSYAGFKKIIEELMKSR